MSLTVEKPLLTGEKSGPTPFREEAATSLIALLERQLELSPHSRAVVFGEKSLTCKQLHEQAERIAATLVALGCGPGHFVGIAAERSPEMVVGLVGILKSGAAYVPIDPGYPAERLAFIIADSQISVLLAQPSVPGKLPPHHAEIILLQPAETTDAKEACGFSRPHVSATDPAYMIYTSGTTGQPKGVVIPQRAICNQLLWMQETYRMTAADRFLQKAPLSFDISVFEIFWPLLGGGEIILARPGGQADPSHLVDLIQREKITLLDFLPAMLEAFLGEPGVENCRTLRQILVGGELITQALVDRFAEVFTFPLDNVYGPTETAIQVARWVCQPRAGLRCIPIGRPVANTQIHVLNPALQPTPCEIAGEIHIGGAQLASGYWNQPALTAQKFIPDPFSDDPAARLYRTGDWGYFDANGVLFFIGRADDQIKWRGHRIELREVGAVVQAHWAIHEAIAILREDRPGDQRLVVYYVLEKDCPAPSQAELRQHSATRLPEYALPSAFVPLEKWPLLPNEKVNRAAFPPPVFETKEISRETLPMTPLELQVAEIWAETLGLPGVGPEDDFFDLGGDSLLGLQLVTAIRHRLYDRVSVAALFETSTVRAMARVLGGSVGLSPDHARGAYLILHHEIAALWLRYLPVDQIGVQEGFFDLGGSRDAARAMLQEVELLFHTPQGLEPFERQPTIECLVAAILKEQESQPPSGQLAILPLSETGSKAPFFYLHGDMTGVGFYCRKLSRLLGGERPFYTLAPADFRCKPWLSDVPAMARQHVADILSTGNTGPFVIGGFCSAGVVAYEIALQLRAQGYTVERLILLETEWAHPLMRLWRWWNNRGTLPPEKRVPAFAQGWGTMEKWRAFQEMSTVEQHAWIRRKLLQEKPPALPELSQADTAWLNEYGEGPVISAWAECAYRPRQIDVPIELILSDDTLCRRRSLLAAWEGLGPSIRHYFLPGSHHGMITSGVDRLAETLRAILADCP